MGINKLKSLTESDAKDRYDRLIDNAKQQSYIDEGTYYEKHLLHSWHWNLRRSRIS